MGTKNPRRSVGPAHQGTKIARSHAWSATRSKLSRRWEAPKSVSYQFLQCFVGFERRKQRTRARDENAQKSRRFGLQNRARERPGDPKSSPGGPVRATKREKVARSSSIFLESGRERARQSEQEWRFGGQERPGPEQSEGMVRQDR